ncbi:uncharacterized protein LOC135822348 [Sycon ciliatum]|uniref:uncharacterized protein LOC135822348 n=1 Tax=Sycon ciliatum TaxID=27933 RepID=UPI0020AD53BE|eukprot:scpid88810/ scgid28593/ 
MASSNPWTENHLACVSLGNLDDVLRVAAQHGHTLQTPKAPASSSHSLRLISLLCELTDLHRQLDTVSSQLNILSERQATVDLTDNSKAENWLHDVKGLSDHLCKVLNEKQHLISLLSEPLAGQHIAIDAKYHRAVAGMYPALVKCLSAVPSHLAALQWAADNLCCREGVLIPSITSSSNIGKHGFPDLSKTTEAFTSLQSHFRKLQENRRALGKILKSSDSPFDGAADLSLI